MRNREFIDEQLESYFIPEEQEKVSNSSVGNKTITRIVQNCYWLPRNKISHNNYYLISLNQVNRI